MTLPLMLACMTAPNWPALVCDRVADLHAVAGLHLRLSPSSRVLLERQDNAAWSQADCSRSGLGS
jgi:hypothetical protein